MYRNATLIGSIFLARAACGDDDAADGNAWLRVIHASSDAPAVDIDAEGVSAPLVSDLAYGEASAYLDLAPGIYNIQIRAAGAAPSSAPVYQTGDLELTDGAAVSAVAAGLIASTGADDAFRVLALAEDFGAPGADTARVRVVHAGADAPTVAIDVGDDGSAELDGLARFADTGADGVELPAGTALQLAIRAGAPLARVTAFTSPELPVGADLFVIATPVSPQP